MIAANILYFDGNTLGFFYGVDCGGKGFENRDPRVSPTSFHRLVEKDYTFLQLCVLPGQSTVRLVDKQGRGLGKGGVWGGGITQDLDVLIPWLRL